MKVTSIAGVPVLATALKAGRVTVVLGPTLGRVAEAGVGKFRAALEDGTELGTFRTRVGAAEAVLEAAGVPA